MPKLKELVLTHSQLFALRTMLKLEWMRRISTTVASVVKFMEKPPEPNNQTQLIAEATGLLVDDAEVYMSLDTPLMEAADKLKMSEESNTEIVLDMPEGMLLMLQDVVENGAFTMLDSLKDKLPEGSKLPGMDVFNKIKDARPGLLQAFNSAVTNVSNDLSQDVNVTPPKGTFLN